jgi:hypothetical protein
VKNNQLPLRSMSSSSLLVNSEDPSQHLNGAADHAHLEDLSIPDERDWRREVQNLRDHATEFNIQRFVRIVLTPEE